MTIDPRNLDRVRACLGCLLILGSVARAADPATGNPVPGWHYGVDAGLGEIDNVTLVETDKIAQTVALADADFTLFEQSRRFVANLAGDFSYIDYLQGAYKGQLIGRFDGLGSVAMIPEKLSWLFQEDFGQGQVNPFAAQVPTNLQNINSFSTGPKLNLLLGGLNHLTIDLHYTRTEYQDSPLSSNRYFSGIQLGLPLSARSEVALNASFQRLLYVDTALDSDYSNTSAFGSYELHGARTDVTAKLGVSRIDITGSETTGPLALLVLSRRISPYSRVSLSAGRSSTDAASSFSDLTAGAIAQIAISQATQTPSVFTQTYGSLSWTYLRGGLQWALSGRYESDKYDNEPVTVLATNLATSVPVAGNASLQDGDRYGGEFSITKALTRAFSTDLLGSFYDTTYAHGEFLADAGGSRYTDARFGGGITWRRPKGLEVRLRYSHALRSLSGAALGNGYSQNVVFITVGYHPR